MKRKPIRKIVINKHGRKVYPRLNRQERVQRILCELLNRSDLDFIIKNAMRVSNWPKSKRDNVRKYGVFES